MGYSIATKFKTEKAQKEMLAFLESQSDLVKSILMTDCHNTFMVNGQVLDYSPKLKQDVLLGFNTRTTAYSQWALCIWMAMKLGAKNKNGDNFIYYDRAKSTVKLLGNPEEVNYIDKDGILIQMRPTKAIDIDKLDYPDKDKTIALLRNLNENWEVVMSKKYLNKNLKKKSEPSQKNMTKLVKI